MAARRVEAEHVLDTAGLIPLAEAGQLQHQAQALEAELGIWLQFVTVPGVEEGSARDLGLSLAERMSLSQSPEKNDMLVLWVSEPSSIEVVVGDGLRPVYSVDWEEELMRTLIHPELERGQGASALVRWMHKVDARLRRFGSDSRAGATAPLFGRPPPPAPAEPVAPWLKWAGGTLAFSIGLGAAAVALFGRRFCFNHPVPFAMSALPEWQDQEHMSALQRQQESVDPFRHDVLRCALCGQIRVISRELPGA